MIPFFSGMNRKQLEEFASCMKLERIRNCQYLYKQGRPVRYIFVIVRGEFQMAYKPVFESEDRQQEGDANDQSNDKSKFVYKAL